MMIVIPTYRRIPRQSTLSFLPESWLKRTVLVVDREDANLAPLYESSLRGVDMIVHPEDIDTIAKKRAWIIRNYGLQWGKLVMFDDDLRFAVRCVPCSDQIPLRQSQPEDLASELAALEHKLGEVVHAGWSARQGNNTRVGGWHHNSRMMYVLGYDCATLAGLDQVGDIELGRIETREDMDLTLQLLRLGYRNAVNYDIAADQMGGFAAKGGCETQRTLESSNKDACRLAELHPGLVRVEAKRYKGSSWDRLEVVCQWKKAYEQGQEYRAMNSRARVVERIAEIEESE